MVGTSTCTLKKTLALVPGIRHVSRLREMCAGHYNNIVMRRKMEGWSSGLIPNAMFIKRRG